MTMAHDIDSPSPYCSHSPHGQEKQIRSWGARKVTAVTPMGPHCAPQQPTKSAMVKVMPRELPLAKNLWQDTSKKLRDHQSGGRAGTHGNIYDGTSASAQTAFMEWNETINYFQEHCNAKGTHLIIHYPRNVDIMLIKMKGESHFHFLLRFMGAPEGLFALKAGPGDEELFWGGRRGSQDETGSRSRSRNRPPSRKREPRHPCPPPGSC